MFPRILYWKLDDDALDPKVAKEKAEECVNTLKAKQKVLFLTRDCGEVQVIPYDEYFKLCVERNNQGI